MQRASELITNPRQWQLESSIDLALVIQESVRIELVEMRMGSCDSTCCACAVGANTPYSHGLPLAGTARTAMRLKTHSDQ